MKKNHCYSANLDYETEILFKKAKFLGQGNNGIVYRLPEDKVIKFFVEEKVWYDEAYILSRTRNSKYFPKLYRKGKMYIVREMVHGIRLDKYLKNNQLNKEIVNNIYNMTKEFKRLNFTKIDTRCKDIFVDSDYSIKIIDPKKCFKRNVDFPRHLMKGLLKLNKLEDFFTYMEDMNIKKTSKWKQKFNVYWKKEKKKKK